MAAPSSPNTDELFLLANAISLEYPPNPLQVNTAVLVLAYLLSRGMGGVKNILRDSTNSSFYIDEFAQEIYTIYFRKSGMLYIDSKLTDPETGDPEFSLGNEEDAKLGLIEYKVRRELLTLMRENPTRIDELEQEYDAQDKTVPFNWVRQIKTGYFNVLLGGKDREKVSIGVNILNKLNKSINKLNILPAEEGRDSLNKG